MKYFCPIWGVTTSFLSLLLFLYLHFYLHFTETKWKHSWFRFSSFVFVIKQKTWHVICFAWCFPCEKCWKKVAGSRRIFRLFFSSSVHILPLKLETRQYALGPPRTCKIIWRSLGKYHSFLKSAWKMVFRDVTLQSINC